MGGPLGRTSSDQAADWPEGRTPRPLQEAELSGHSRVGIGQVGPGRRGCSCHVVRTVFSSRGCCSAGCMNWGRAPGVLLGGGATLLLSFLWMPALLPVASRLLLLPRALLSMASGSPPSQPSPASGSGYVPGTVSAAFVTCPNEKVAKEIARAVVEKRLAACVNLIPQITSIYEWKGKIEEDNEVLMMIKTQSSLVPALTEFVRSVHPYEVAEVIALPVEQGNPSYLHWVHQVTESVSDSGTALP